MKNFVRFIGSAVIALILVSIPGLLVTSIAFEWHGFLKLVFCVATGVECMLAASTIYEMSEHGEEE